MSSFYDRTDRILVRMAERRTPAGVWVEVVTQRMAQARAYFTWVAARRDTPIAQIFPPGNAWNEQMDDWRMALGLDGAVGWWEARLGLVAKTGQLFARLTDPLYHPATRPLPLNALARYWFGELHDLGHAVARASGARLSDNPYPPRPQPRGMVIPNSDRWLKAAHPDLWVD